ncbi:MAG: carboxypeptidase-like regulatory domain-containing protein [Cellulophaga sp.]
MNTLTTKLTLLLLISGHYFAISQSINSKIVDSITQKPIPYATILLSNNKGVISNMEGRFNLNIDKTVSEKDSIFISIMGYESKAITLKHFKDSIIYLSEKAIALNDVIVSNKNYTAEEIIDLVEDNLEKNYTTNLTKKRVFFRESYRQNFSKMDYTFVKSSIKELNKAFLDSVIQSVPKIDNRYTEILCDLYGDFSHKKQRIHLIKASELYDKNSEIDLEKLEEKFNKILKENVKPDSYFKIKSGLFGTKVSAEDMFDSEEEAASAEALKKELEEKKKREKQRKTNFALYRRNTMGRLFESMFFNKDSKLNFIHKSSRYEFTLQDFTYIGEDPVYVIDFKPKRSSDYRGTLYINSDDFAVVRVDYSNVKPIRDFSMLGISFKHYLSKGKMFFSKGENNSYNLRYFERESGSVAGIRRPLKIIEKNKHVKGRRKQNELSVKLDMAITNINKYEIVVFNTENISSETFDAFKENNKMLPTYMPSYDASFWKGYNIIEPNQAIKKFTAQDEL